VTLQKNTCPSVKSLTVIYRVMIQFRLMGKESPYVLTSNQESMICDTYTALNNHKATSRELRHALLQLGLNSNDIAKVTEFIEQNSSMTFESMYIFLKKLMVLPIHLTISGKRK
jgi:hypothetical protein